MNNLKISIICAVDKKGGIGFKNQLLVHFPEDLKRFKKMTTGHVVIMGKTTYQSMGKALPNRTNIVMAFEKDLKLPDAIVVNSVEQALVEANKVEQSEIFVIGGGSIYKQFIDIADRLYLTVIDREFEADTFFPDYSKFAKVISQEEYETDDFSYKYLVLEH